MNRHRNRGVHATRALIDHPAISERYFFPKRNSPLRASPNATVVELRSPDGTRLAGYFRHPFKNAPTLLFLYGNGGTIAETLNQNGRDGREGVSKIGAICDTAGLNLFMVDYPGYGSSSGTPTFTGCRLAAQAGLDFLLKQSENDLPENDLPAVIVMGHSAGTIFALDAVSRDEVASNRHIKGVILASGVADLKQRLDIRIPYDELSIDRDALHRDIDRDYDQCAKIKRIRVPITVVHAVDDEVIPAWHGELLARWAQEAGTLKRAQFFKTGGHNDIFSANLEAFRDLY